MTLTSTLRAWFKPKVLLPLVLAGALLFVALSLGDAGKVMGRVGRMPWSVWVLVPGLAAVYLLCKAAQLQLLLHNLKARGSWRRFGLAYAVGELSLTLPMGVFAQNVVLARDENIDFGRSAAATVLMLLLEMALVLLWLAVTGIPGWAPLQPLAAVALAGMVLLLIAGVYFRSVLERLAGRVRLRPLRWTLKQIVELLAGLRQLSSLRMLGLNLLLMPIYLGALGAAFLLVGHGVGLHRLGFVEAATIYAFSLAAILMTGGLSGQVGTVEVVGMSAAKAYGVEYTDGLALMLGFRLVWTGAIWLLCGPLAFALRGALRPDGPDESDDRGGKPTPAPPESG